MGLWYKTEESQIKRHKQTGKPIKYFILSISKFLTAVHSPVFVTPCCHTVTSGDSCGLNNRKATLAIRFSFQKRKLQVIHQWIAKGYRIICPMIYYVFHNVCRKNTYFYNLKKYFMKFKVAIKWLKTAN